MESLKIKDYMLTRPVAFQVSQPIAQVVQELLEHKQIGAPVINDKREIVGWISEQDCLARLIEATYHCELVSNVEDVMTTNVLSISPDESVLELAQTMLGAKPKMYPVVEQERLVGVITRRQIMAALETHLNACYSAPSKT